jgi:hypothetical protein
MTTALETLVLDLVEWIGPSGRTVRGDVEQLEDVLPPAGGMRGGQRA